MSFVKKSRSTGMLERHCMELFMRQVLPGLCSPVAPVCGGQPVVATSSLPVASRYGVAPCTPLQSSFKPSSTYSISSFESCGS